jgi:hypothetical protein
MVDLPAPIMPTSTMERVPSAAVISASWKVLVVAGKTVSDIKAHLLRICRVRRHHTTPADTVASAPVLNENLRKRESECPFPPWSPLQRTGEHVGSHLTAKSMIP